MKVATYVSGIGLPSVAQCGDEQPQRSSVVTRQSVTRSRRVSVLAHSEDALGARGGASASNIAGLAVEVKHHKGNAKQGADDGVNETADRATSLSGFAFLS